MATSATSRSTAPIPIRTRGRSGASSDFVAPSALAADARRGHSSTTAKAMQATGIATRARPRRAPVPSASADPTGPARSVQSPRAQSTPITTSPTAAASARWPESWRDAAARPFASALGPCEAGRDRVVDRFWGRFRADGLALERERPLPRVLVAGIPAR